MNAKELDATCKRMAELNKQTVAELDRNFRRLAQSMATATDAMRGFARAAELLNKTLAQPPTQHPEARP